ncbi:uncharacterized protein LOC112449954 [Kryptolebias marmoratus]|uniref:uncharacterized protein LOC112449954 n=1 Tax=Kryptolebias marmoratus TaxID=37003 RepID=UPI000D52F302|nr:uncharacterized protein LOC112449954 [Kryptolebias marmoratus]
MSINPDCQTARQQPADLCDIMSAHTWIVLFICAAGCHLSSSSPAPRSPQAVHLGQNVSLTCNISSSLEITWYLLRSDQLLPLLRVTPSKLKGKEPVAKFYSVNSSHVSWTRDPDNKLFSLEILAVEEDDAGLYFCSGWCGSDVCVDKGIHLKVKGDEEDSAGGQKWQPCYNLGICILPALLSLGFLVIVGFYLCSGKLVCCCCNPASQGSRCKVTEEESLHYSSLKHPDKPRPIGRERPRFTEDMVTYSAVTSRRN